MATIAALLDEWKEAGPVAWCEDSYGWLDVDGKPISLLPWQHAALSAWWERRESIRTLALSNIKKTGKSLANAVLTTWRFLCLPGEHFCAANDLDQSTSRQFAMAADMVKRNSLLRKYTKITGKQLTFTPTGSTLTALAVDAAGNAGANHLTASHTEAWGIEYELAVRAFEELTTPPGLFYGFPALRICDSYSGFEGQSATWHNLVDRGLAGERLPSEWPIYQDGGLLLFHIEGEEAQARCFRGTTEEAAAYYADERKTQREGTYGRLHLNKRTQSVEENFIDAAIWQDCFNPLVKPLMPGDPASLVVGLDFARGGNVTNDHVGLVAVARWGSDSYAVKFCKEWWPVKGQRFVEDNTILETLEWLISNFTVFQIAYDPNEAASLIAQLQGRIWCDEFSQQQLRVDADTFLHQTLISKKLYHYGDTDLTRHVLQASVELKGESGLRLEKSNARRKNDLAVALSMALWRCRWNKGLNLPSDPASTATIVQQHFEPEPTAPVQPMPINGPPIEVMYFGIDPEGSFSIQCADGQTLPVWRHRIYSIAPAQWSAIQADSNLAYLWQRVIKKYPI